jgi:hypothetical protein
MGIEQAKQLTRARGLFVPGQRRVLIANLYREEAVT